jgi:hypothetical protein
MLDLRVPTGLFFSLVGFLLLLARHSRAELTSINVNLYAGLVMLAFGAVLLALARKNA